MFHHWELVQYHIEDWGLGEELLKTNKVLQLNKNNKFLTSYKYLLTISRS